MKGRIKTFKEDRGFGFILGEDEHDYFFHISDVKSIEAINRGQIVDFTPSKGEKGLIAKSIYIKSSSSNTQKKFVSFGNVRLKASNIKSYGISVGEDGGEVEEYRPATNKEMLRAALISPAGFWLGMGLSEGNPQVREKIKTKSHYLYVTTFQGDNYRFWEHEVNFDIFKKRDELDELL